MQHCSISVTVLSTVGLKVLTLVLIFFSNQNMNSAERTLRFGLVTGHQLQQNQLVLSLNQSYFQLVTNQNTLIDRFNRLEQLVLSSTPPPSTAAGNAVMHSGTLGHDDVSTPGYSLFTGTQSPFNLNNCESRSPSF